MSNEVYTYFDLHLHSKASVDSKAEPADIIETARARGLSGLALPDHDTVKGQKEMRGLMHKNGLIFLDSSVEITTRFPIESKKAKRKGRLPHILAINIPPDELKSFIDEHPFPEIHPLKFRFKQFKALATTDETLEWISQFANTLAIAAHPAVNGNLTSLSFDQIKYYADRGLLDGMEVFNYGPRRHDIDRFVLARDLDLAMLGDSDAHRAKKVGKVVTRIPGRPESAEEVVYKIKQRQCEPFIPDHPDHLEKIKQEAKTIYKKKAA